MIDWQRFWDDLTYQADQLSQEYLCLGEVFNEAEDGMHEVALNYWQTDSGHEFLPVFSTLEQLQQLDFEEDCSYVVLPLAVIFELVEAEISIIIDLETEDEQVCDAQDIAHILQRVIQ